MTFNPEKRYETNPFVDVNAITTSKKRVIIGQGNDILFNGDRMRFITEIKRKSINKII